MRTTIAIDDHLLEEAKERARQNGTTLGRLIEDAVRRELNRRDPGEAPPIPVFTGGGGFNPNIDLSSNRAIQEFLDEGMAPEKLR